MNCKHDVGVERKPNKDVDTLPAVWLANDDDSFYCQYSESRAELEKFIEKLKAAAK